MWRKCWEGLLLHGTSSASPSERNQLCESNGEEILAKVPAVNWAVHMELVEGLTELEAKHCQLHVGLASCFRYQAIYLAEPRSTRAST